MKKKIIAAVTLCLFIMTAFPFVMVSGAADSYYLKAFTLGIVNFRETPGGRIIDTPVSDLIYVDVYSNNNGYYAAQYEGNNGYISRVNVRLLEKNVYVHGDYSYYIGDTLKTARNGEVLKFYVDTNGNLLSKDTMQKVGLPAGTGLITVPISTFTVYHSVAEQYTGHNKNTDLASSRANAVIYPNQAYSCNGIMGWIGKETGYYPAIEYNNGQQVMGYGGGACEVSTTLYNAVRLAGFPVIERHLHGLPIHYVDWNKHRDATIDNGVDFRWVNDRDTPVRVQFTSGFTTITGENQHYLTVEISEVV